MQAILDDGAGATAGGRLKERRLTGRVQKAWKARAEGGLPSWADMRDTDLGPDWQFCFAIDLALSNDRPYFIYMGERLARLSEIYLPASERWDVTPLDLVAAKMDETALSRAPVAYSDVFRIPDGRKVLFRSLLAPLSDNGADVTHVLGAVNGKGA